MVSPAFDEAGPVDLTHLSRSDGEKPLINQACVASVMQRAYPRASPDGYISPFVICRFRLTGEI